MLIFAGCADVNVEVNVPVPLTVARPQSLLTLFSSLPWGRARLKPAYIAHTTE